jgi:hypothetical protein
VHRLSRELASKCCGYGTEPHIRRCAFRRPYRRNLPRAAPRVSISTKNSSKLLHSVYSNTATLSLPILPAINSGAAAAFSGLSNLLCAHQLVFRAPGRKRRVGRSHHTDSPCIDLAGDRASPASTQVRPRARIITNFGRVGFAPSRSVILAQGSLGFRPYGVGATVGADRGQKASRFGDSVM